MTSTSTGLGAILFPPGSPPSTLPLEGATDVMDFFHHSAVLELVLDRVWVMRTSRFKKFLKVAFGLLSLSLEVMFVSCYKPLIGSVSFRTVVAIAGHYGNATWSTRFYPFQPP
jgi:hypothetical protein